MGATSEIQVGIGHLMVGTPRRWMVGTRPAHPGWTRPLWMVGTRLVWTVETPRGSLRSREVIMPRVCLPQRLNKLVCLPIEPGITCKHQQSLGAACARAR